MKRKILFISNESRLGGAELSLLSLVEGLPADKYSKVVALPDEGPLYKRLEGAYPTVLFPMKKLFRDMGMLGTARRLVQMVKTGMRMAAYVRRESIDVIYSNGIQAQLYGMIIRIFSFRSTVWHVRDRNPGLLISKCCATASARVVCISQFVYQQTPGSPGKKRLIYNGLDTGVWSPTPERRGIPGMPVLPEGALIVGQVGQLIPWKRHGDLIRAAAEVVRRAPRVYFVILGEDPAGQHPGYVDGLKELVRAEGLSDHFFFAGYTADIKESMNQLDVLVHCAEGEPFGRVVVEAMALEKAVIAYRSGGCAELVEHEVSGLLVEPRQVDALAEAVVGLINDERKRATLGKRARQRVIERFDIAGTIRLVTEVIDGL